MARVCVCPDCEARWDDSGVRVDPMRHRLSWRGGAVELRPLESRLLAALVDAAGCVARREALIDAVWGDREDGGPDNDRGDLRVLMHGLRRQLAAADFPGTIRTWRRSGYEMVLGAAHRHDRVAHRPRHDRVAIGRRMSA